LSAPKVSLFGHFGGGNFGNESTLQAMLCQLREVAPVGRISCICSFPEIVAAEYNIAAMPIARALFAPWKSPNRVVKLLRKLLMGVPSEGYRWLCGIRMLWGTDIFAVVGTGLLTDAFSLEGWGPYSTFKWTFLAKLCRCRVCFVSVGAGPLNRATGRFLVRWALRLADFRSYRDRATQEYVASIGVRAYEDRICPDLAFSLPPKSLQYDGGHKTTRSVVGLGLMAHGGMYSVGRPPSAEEYAAYLETLVQFVQWLLSEGYDVRLLIGDLADTPVLKKFTALLRDRAVVYDSGRVIDAPIVSAKGLLDQLAQTDFVVGTRFHNVLLALLLKKPSIAISFHHKCSSLMSQMGLSEYCLDIRELRLDRLMEQFCVLRQSTDIIKNRIEVRIEDCRKLLDLQYRTILKGLCVSERA